MLDWQEAGRPSIGLEARGVQEVVERRLRNEEKSSSKNLERMTSTNLGICHKFAGWGMASSSGGRVDTQQGAKMYQSDHICPGIKDQS